MTENEPHAPLTIRTLRQFAGLWVLFFGALACIAMWRRADYAAGTGLGALALGVGLPGLVFPELLRPIYLTWTVLVRPIGWTISLLLVGSIFYILLTPVGLLFRLFGRDVLHLRPPRGEGTLWSPKPTATDPRRYFRQF